MRNKTLWECSIKSYQAWQHTLHRGYRLPEQEYDPSAYTPAVVGCIAMHEMIPFCPPYRFSKRNQRKTDEPMEEPHDWKFHKDLHILVTSLRPQDCTVKGLGMRLLSQYMYIHVQHSHSRLTKAHVSHPFPAL